MQYRRTPEYMSSVTGAFVGVDVGKRKDFSTIAVLFEGVWDYDLKKFMPPTHYPRQAADRLRDLNMSNRWRYRPPDSTIYLAKLERIRLGTPYPEVVERACQVAHATARYANTQVVLDRTGVGDGVLDMFYGRDVWPVPVVITGGETVTYNDGTYNVPKTQLITRLDVAFQSGRIAYNPDLPMLEEFKAELDSFEEVRSESTGALSYKQIRSSKTGHADLVLAVALALFFRNHYFSNIDLEAWGYWRQRSQMDPADISIIEELRNFELEYPGY